MLHFEHRNRGALRSVLAPARRAATMEAVHRDTLLGAQPRAKRRATVRAVFSDTQSAHGSERT